MVPWNSRFVRPLVYRTIGPSVECENFKSFSKMIPVHRVCLDHHFLHKQYFFDMTSKSVLIDTITSKSAFEMTWLAVLLPILVFISDVVG